MTVTTILKIEYGLCLLIVTGSISLGLIQQHRSERNVKKGHRRYSGFLFNIWHIPLLFGMMLPWSLLFEEMLLEWYADFVVSICLYHLALLPFLPMLRRLFSARCCGVLWLLPATLYYGGIPGRWFRKPLLVLPIWKEWLSVLMDIWLVGCVAVLTWKIMQHLLFRRKILRDAEPVKDQRVLDTWKAERTHVFSSKDNWELVVSPHVRTPLSIGITQGTTTVVLPKGEYTDEELALIFRHELIHISRGDGMNKFFLTFCTAMCWFSPLAWMSMRKSAEDFELSCDESVLLNEGDAVRRQYAGLILSTAGEEKGFTTCLAVSVSAMRYRLKNIVRRRRLRSGAVLVFALCIVMTATMGTVALGYDYTTAREAVAQRMQTQQVLPETVIPGEEGAQCPDAQALQALLEELKLCRLISDREDDGKVLVTMQFPDGVEAILRVNTLTLKGGGEKKVTYYITSKADRAHLESLFI